MRFASLLALSILGAACGPSAAEIEATNEARAQERRCTRLHSAQKKVLEEALWARGVAEVTLIDREAYAAKCVEFAFTDAEIACMDPNKGGDENCKATLASRNDDVRAMASLLMSPMTGKGGDKPAEAPAEGEAAPAEGEAAPAEGDAPAAGDGG